MIACPRRKPPNDHTCRFLVLPRHQPEHRGEQTTPVRDHVQGQDQDQEQVGNRPQARHGNLLEGPSEFRGIAAQVVEEGTRLRGQIDAGQAEPVEPGLPWRHDRWQVVPQGRDARDEIGNRTRQSACDGHGEDYERTEQQNVDDHHGPRPG